MTTRLAEAYASAAPDATDVDGLGQRPDLRVVVLAVAAWSGGLAGFLLPPRVLGGLCVGAVTLLLVRRHRAKPVLVVGAWMLAACAVAASALLRSTALDRSPVADLARVNAQVSVRATVTSDPVLREGRFAPVVLVRIRVREVTGRGVTSRSAAPVLVVAGAEWRDVELGSLVSASGRLSPADQPDLAGVLFARRPATEVRGPSGALVAAADVRAGIRAAVAPLGPPESSLIPALVVGDDATLPPQVVEDFQVSGLTHLAAVSGTNLTLVVGFLLILARWAGVRARGLIAVGVVGVVGFILLARTEPSVVRAAAMGSVALLGMGSGGRGRGVRALGVAVLVLLLVDPFLALSLGFALSALATAGILFLAPPWRDALMRWLPRWVAEAVAVPLAAQVACTPVVAAISGQVSLVAVAANLLVAAAVGPATVLGLVAGLFVLAWEPLGLLVGRLAGACAWWIVAVAEHSASLPAAAVGWSSSGLAIAVLAALCLVCVLVMPALLGRRWWALAAVVALVVAVLRPWPGAGWPPPGWVMVVCDVGQGDGIVLNAGTGAAVVVDAGPDADAMDDCLERLGVRRLPVVVLTHFHADHVAGLTGAMAGRDVGEILVAALQEPAGGAHEVGSVAGDAGVPVRTPSYGEVRRIGSLTWQVVGPSRGLVTGSAPDAGSAPNNASLVVLAQVRGVRLLLGADMEPEAQRLLARSLPDLRADVLKVPHHGSRYQDPDLLGDLGATLAVISVGAANDYGHPAPETMALLDEAGMLVRRTDESGDIAVVVDGDGELRVVTRGRSRSPPQ